MVIMAKSHCVLMMNMNTMYGDAQIAMLWYAIQCCTFEHTVHPVIYLLWLVPCAQGSSGSEKCSPTVPHGFKVYLVDSFSSAMGEHVVYLVHLMDPLFVMESNIITTQWTMGSWVDLKMSARGRCCLWWEAHEWIAAQKGPN